MLQSLADNTYSQFLIEEIMYGNQTNLAQSDQKELLIDFYYRMKDKGKKEFHFVKFREYV